MTKQSIRHYIEGLEDCEVEEHSPMISVTWRIAKGVWLGRGKGYRTKRDAVAFCERINSIMGREVVRYFGKLDESGCGLTVRNIKV